ncbi:HEAT repeat domain-containing protein [Chitinophaga solisilvae]|uniref:HEAT repeat domain-containing protein n=1 Tax=Chitinophaga solisilvae TaxID=1233460 RepID=UPI00136C91C4|nr:HEAT repeat domain-containing protein [Chitinophaga solisilvae]
MRFVRNVKLFFREGNSDKTYEIDLCEVGPDQYLVNFRYGKRFGNLKEGTKTTSPVSLSAATTIFDALEKEKRSKGYLGEQEAVQDLAFTPVDVSGVEDVRHRAIIKRLQGAAEGKPAFKTDWKASRVIWKAGELKVKEAVPYLIKLIEKGDAIQRYSALWSLGKLEDAAAAPVLRSYMENGSYPLNVRMLAANGLLLVLPEEEKNAFIQTFFLRLPEIFQETITRNVAQEIYDLIYQRIYQQEQPAYPLLEELYIIAWSNAAVKQAMLTFLTHLPLRPSWFQHIRHIFKQAELRNDQGIVAVLAARFEREAAMFNNPGVRLDYDDNEYIPSVYIPELQEAFKAQKELKRPTSKLAWSNKTKGHFNRRVLRNLRNFGVRGDNEYVRLATALLLQYEEERDATKEYQVRNYKYVNNRYTTVYTQFPANSRAVFLTYILRGAAANIRLTAARNEWYFADELDSNGHVKPATTLKANPDAQTNTDKNNLIKKLFGWFSGGQDKNTVVSGVPKEYSPEPATVKSEVPFLELWQQMPQAFIQLLVSGRMEMVHIFAMEQLKAHPEYAALKEKMDEKVIYNLLQNPFSIPAFFGLELAREKYNPAAISFFLLYALTVSPLEPARIQGLEWVSQHLATCFGDADFLVRMIYSPYKDVRAFVRQQLKPEHLSPDYARVVVGKAFAGLLAAKDASDEVNENLNDGNLILEEHFAAILKDTGIAVVEDLLQSVVPANHAFAARLLLLKDSGFNFAEVSDTLIQRLATNGYAPVRTAGIGILQAMPAEELLKRPELLLSLILATHTDVRNHMRPLIATLVQQNSQLAIYLVNELVPRLMRKETAEGIHDDIGTILSNELVNFLQDVDTATALRLLYSNYRAAQKFGVVVLEKYIPAEALTLKQVIAAGSHELLEVREWCWNFYNRNAARIRYERDAAIGILDAKWDDSRHFAKTFFRTQFTENDWTPETLIAIADSVRPDIQAFGREMLLQFFKADDGPAYLLKLSQHPSVLMQVFATGYLENYAAGNLAYLQQLEHYFRAVLSRVNKARVAKERIFAFLEKEALKSAEAAACIGNIIAHISATVSIGDKARCITIMRNIQQQQSDVALPVTIIPARIKS